MDIFSGISWDTDIYPKFIEFMNQDIIKAPIILILVIVLGTFAATQLLKTWGK